MGQKVRTPEALSYALLSFGQTLISMFVSTYILYYYTDVLLLPAASVSVMFLLARLLDGGVDPIIGYHMDRHSPRHGKFKGYLAKCIAPLFLFSVLLFTAPPVGGNGGVIICLVIYILWSLFFSIVEGVNGALAVSLSADAQQRRSLNSFRMVASIAATLIVTYLSLYLVERLGRGDEGHGYFITMLLFSAVGVIAIIPAIRTVKERNYKMTNRHSLRECAVILMHDRQLLLFLLMYLVNQIASTVKTQTAIYHLKYMHGGIGMVPIFFLIGRCASLLAQPLIIILSNRIRPIHLMTAGYTLAGLAMTGIAFAGSSVWALISLSSLSSFFSAFPANLAFTYSAEIADSISQKNDDSFSGITSSLMGLFSKVGVSIAGAAVSMILAITSYVPNVREQAAIGGIKLCFVGVTAAMYFLSGILALKSDGRKNALVRSEKVIE